MRKLQVGVKHALNGLHEPATLLLCQGTLGLANAESGRLADGQWVDRGFIEGFVSMGRIISALRGEGAVYRAGVMGVGGSLW